MSWPNKRLSSKDDILVVIPEASRLTAESKIPPSFMKSLRRGLQQQQQLFGEGWISIG